MSFSSSTRNHAVIDFAGTSRILGTHQGNLSRQTSCCSTSLTAAAQALTTRVNSLHYINLDLNPSLFVLSSFPMIRGELEAKFAFVNQALSPCNDAETKHRAWIKTAPAMGAVTASQNADDPDSPRLAQAMLSGRYAYSDHSKAHQGAFWRFFKLCFTPMSTCTAFRSGHVPARRLPHHGQTTSKNHCRVTANIPKQHCAEQRRSPSTALTLEPNVVSLGCGAGPTARRGFGFQGGRDDWSAIFQVARGSAA